MKTVSILSNNKLTFGNPESIGNHLGLNPETIRRWIREGKKVEVYNNLFIFLDCDKIK